jgi:hypothetical protein
MSEDFKSNFITAGVEAPLKELEELNSMVKKKKAEVRKALFYAKHPDLLQAKKEYDTKMASVNAEKFNEAIAEVQVQVKEEPKPKVNEPEPVKLPEPEPVKATVPVSSPTFVPTKQAPVQHSHKPLVVGLNSKWF